MSIIVRNLVCAFGKLRAVDGVSFEIDSGGVVGLIGPNGAGKTTLLRVLTTYLESTGGTAFVGGFDCRFEPREVRRRIGYLPETAPSSPHARISEYLRFRAALKGISRKRRAVEIARVLEFCELQDAKHRLIGRLSSGFRRRVAIADTLLGDPPVLILDEPTIGLDPLQVVRFRETLRELAEQRTILLSTHILAEAEAVCSRVLMLNGGRLAGDVNLDDSAGRSLEEQFVRAVVKSPKRAA